jgi:hypothetical protein
VAIKKALLANKNLHISFTFPLKKFQILGNVANTNFGLAKAPTTQDDIKLCRSKNSSDLTPLGLDNSEQLKAKHDVITSEKDIILSCNTCCHL